MPELAPLPTRAERAAQAAKEDAAKFAELARAVGTAAEAGADPTIAGDVVANLEAGHAARASSRTSKPIARQLATHGRDVDDAPPPSDALAHHAKPPFHIPYNVKAEERARAAVLKGAAANGRRACDTVSVPHWIRDLVQRCVDGKRHALSELSALPGWARDSVLCEAKPYGGAESVAGRNMIGISIAIWHLGGRLKGRISGMPRSMYTSLTVGAHGKHYSHSSVWHPVHRMGGDLHPDTVRGPRGGRVGAGRNRGFMVAVMCAGWMRTNVPSAAALPGWMIATSGWPFVQVLVNDSPPGDTS